MDLGKYFYYKKRLAVLKRGSSFGSERLYFYGTTLGRSVARDLPKSPCCHLKEHYGASVDKALEDDTRELEDDELPVIPTPPSTRTVLS